MEKENDRTFGKKIVKKMNNQVEIFQSNDGKTQINVKFEQETVWLNKEQMGILFGRDRTVINKHINNIFTEKELDKKVVSAFFAHTTQHGENK